MVSNTRIWTTARGALNHCPNNKFAALNLVYVFTVVSLCSPIHLTQLLMPYIYIYIRVLAKRLGTFLVCVCRCITLTGRSIATTRVHAYDVRFVWPAASECHDARAV